MDSGSFEEERTDERIIKSKINRFNRLFGYEGTDKMTDIYSYRQMKKLEGERLTVYNSEFAELDSFTGGFAEGELVVITGLFGNGKTLFAQTLLHQFKGQNIPCAIFSYEVSTMKFTDPFGDDRDVPFYVSGENRANNYQWLEERIIEAKVKFNAKIVCIDHLHFIVDMSAEKLHIDIGYVMRRLSLLASIEGLVIFIICHQKSINDNQEPSLNTCRDSSSIPQECHTGIVIHRKKDLTVDGKEADSFDQGLAFVKIDKARRVGTYRKKLTFQKKGDWLLPL